MAHAVMGSVQPGLEVGEDEMDDWQILLRHPMIASFSDGEVFEAALDEAVVAGPVVGDDLCVRRNDLFDEAAEGCFAAVLGDSERTRPA